MFLHLGGIVRLALVMLLASSGLVARAADEETKEQRDARMKWWREVRFGMFIHWGIYSVPAGTWNGRELSAFDDGPTDPAALTRVSARSLQQCDQSRPISKCTPQISALGFYLLEKT